MKRTLSILIILLAMATTISAQSLTPRQKHLATIAALKGVAPQLAAHKAGADNMGNSQEVVDALCLFLSENGLSKCVASD